MAHDQVEGHTPMPDQPGDIRVIALAGDLDHTAQTTLAPLTATRDGHTAR
jgi:hypothetical protein